MRHRMNEMAEAVRRNGEAKRAVWDPADIVGLNGWPLTNYLWWRKKTGYDGPENFCHFLRVALFWAPLRWVGSKIDEMVQHPSTIKVFMALFVSAWLGLMIINGTLLGTLAGIILAASAICGIVVGLHFGSRLFEDDQGIKWFGACQPLTRKAMIIFGAPSAVGMLLVYGVLTFIARLWRKMVRPVAKAGLNWFFGASPSFAPWLRPWMVAIGTLMVLSLFSGTAQDALVSLTVMAVGVGTLLGISWSVNRHEAHKKMRQALREQEKRRATQDLYLAMMFSIVHPEWEGDANRFKSWATRYKKWYQEQTGANFDAMDDAWYIALRAPHRSRLQHEKAEHLFNDRMRSMQPGTKKPAKKTPRRIIPLGVVTFFQLTWALVVTNKWKICPIISIPSAQES